MEQKPLISIVVPVYNSELYLKQSIESIVNQTYKKLEIILVDDGSTDSSSSICDQFSIKDKRIKVIHKENGGVSSARNIGMDVASGEWICFVDSDDTVENKFIETMVSKWNEPNIDLIITSIKDIYSHKETSRNIKQQLSGVFFDDYYKLINFLRGPVAKLYKLDIIKKHRVRFPEKISRGEDQIFNFKFYQYVSKYLFINKCLYNYYHRDILSLSNSYTNKNYQDNLTKLKLEKEFLYSKNIRMKEKAINDSALRCLTTFSLNDNKFVNYNTFKKIYKDIFEFIDIDEKNKGLKRCITLLLLKYKKIYLLYKLVSTKYFLGRIL